MPVPRRYTLDIEDPWNNPEYVLCLLTPEMNVEESKCVSKLTLYLPIMDARDVEGQRYGCKIGDGGRSIVLTLPVFPFYMYNYAERFQGRIHGSEADTKAHSLVATKILGDPAKATKTVIFDLPEDAPARCPAGTSCPLSVNNGYFNTGIADEYMVEQKLFLFGIKWKFAGQPREGKHIFVFYEFVIDGTEEMLTKPKKARDDLSELFAGTLEIEDEDADGTGDGDGDGDGDGMKTN
jgi:hypothetical protein